MGYVEEVHRPRLISLIQYGMSLQYPTVDRGFQALVHHGRQLHFSRIELHL